METKPDDELNLRTRTPMENNGTPENYKGCRPRDAFLLAKLKIHRTDETQWKTEDKILGIIMSSSHPSNPMSEKTRNLHSSPILLWIKIEKNFTFFNVDRERQKIHRYNVKSQ